MSLPAHVLLWSSPRLAQNVAGLAVWLSGVEASVGVAQGGAVGESEVYSIYRFKCSNSCELQPCYLAPAPDDEPRRRTGPALRARRAPGLSHVGHSPRPCPPPRPCCAPRPAPGRGRRVSRKPRDRERPQHELHAHEADGHSVQHLVHVQYVIAQGQARDMMLATS